MEFPSGLFGDPPSMEAPETGIHVQWVKGAWVENPVQHPR